MTDTTHGDRLYEWEAILERCAYTDASVCLMNNFDLPSFRKWMGGERIPNKKNIRRIEAAMGKIRDTNKIQKHPSYGYATTEQIEELKSLGMGPTRDRLMALIEKQNKNQGKV